jgi:hypothetical protein
MISPRPTGRIIKMGWTVVEDESPAQVVFDTFGDKFTATYEGMVVIPVDSQEPDGESFTQLRFRAPDGYFAINAGFKLLRAFDKIAAGSLVRITYVKDVDTSGGKLNPMKDFKVEVNDQQ